MNVCPDPLFHGAGEVFRGGSCAPERTALPMGGVPQVSVEFQKSIFPSRLRASRPQMPATPLQSQGTFTLTSSGTIPPVRSPVGHVKGSVSAKDKARRTGLAPATAAGRELVHGPLQITDRSSGAAPVTRVPSSIGALNKSRTRCIHPSC